MVQKETIILSNPLEVTLTFYLSGLDDKFISVPRTRFFYKTQSFIRISAQPPNGVQPIEILWRQGGQRILPKTHPLFSPTLYRGPRGNLFEALDIRTPTIVQSDLYHVTAYNKAKAVTVEFRLILARKFAKLLSQRFP